MRSSNKKLKVIFSTTLALGMFLSHVGSPETSSFSIEERRKLQMELQKKNKELIKNRDTATKNKNNESRNKESLDQKIKETENKIDDSNNYINELSNQILDIRKNICSIEKEIDEESDNLREALVLIDKAGDITALELVLNSKDTDDFLDKANAVKTVGNTVKETIDRLNEKSAQLEVQKANVENIKARQEEEKATLEKNIEELRKLMEESEKLISEYEKMEIDSKKQLEENEAEIKAVDDEIERYYEEQKRKEEERRKQSQKTNNSKAKNPVVSSGVSVNHGGFIWPVPGFSRISSDFTDCIGRSHMHGAIDIAGSGGKCIYGANVVASGSGTVIKVRYSNSGYGNNIIVDHGNGISTQYSHLSKIAVSEGQSVSRGQVIGQVGNSGFSTGPHLDFTFRVNGIKQNPLNYVHA